MDRLAPLYSNSTAPLRSITFVPATKPDKVPFPEGIDILVLDGSSPQKESEADMPRAAQTSKSQNGTDERELFKERDIVHDWVTVRKAGAGLRNLGNTCFMNSVLQCLTHTPPLAEALLRFKAFSGNRARISALSLTQDHVSKALQGRASVLEPIMHCKTLRHINRSFRPGRQEDAHEYLVALLDAMHENLLEGIKPKPPPSVQETSMIYRIFAGKIRSQVKCCECGFESNTVDPFLDISLEITRATTLQRALERFTMTEYLDGANKYKCSRHGRLVRAAKRIGIEKAPNVLVIHLKRFEFSFSGQKISKKVDFETTLDLAPFMTDRRSPPQMYELYAVLVHQGMSVHQGHYYSFVKAPNGLWHHMNDQNVSQVSERVVLAQKAYILFFVRKENPTPAHVSLPNGIATAKASPNGKQPQANHVNQKAEAEPGMKVFKRKRDLATDTLDAPAPVNGAKKGKANQPEGDDVPEAKEQAVDANLDPEGLRERLASHAEASPSQPSLGMPATPFSAAMQHASPIGSPNLPPRHRQTRSAQLKERKAWADANPQQVLTSSPSKTMFSRSWRRYQASHHIHSQHSASLTPSMRGLSPQQRLSKPSRLRNSSSLSELGSDLMDQIGALIPNGHANGPTRQADAAGAAKNGHPNLDPSAESQLQNGSISLHPPTELRGSKAVESDQRAGLGGRAKQLKAATEAALATTGQKAEVESKEETVPSSPRTRQQSAAIKRSTDPALVHEVLGERQNGAGVGPTGEAHWGDVSEDAKQQADDFLRSLEPVQKPLDEYDQEYDRGKTKKVKGLGQPDAWENGNAFQSEWTRKQRNGRFGSQSRGRFDPKRDRRKMNTFRP